MIAGGAGDAALVYYYTQIEPDNERALALAENTLKALPNDANVHTFAGLALCNMGRFKEAVVELHQAVVLDPFTVRFRLNEIDALMRLRWKDECLAAEAQYRVVNGKSDSETIRRLRFAFFGEVPARLDGLSGDTLKTWLYRSRRFEELLKILENELTDAQLSDEARWGALLSKVLYLQRLNRDAEAVKLRDEVIAQTDKANAQPEVDPSIRDFRRAVVLHLAGQADEAIAAYRRYVETRSANNQVSARWSRESDLAKFCANCGHPRECVELLAKLLRVPSGLTVPMLKVDPTWDSVREDAAFKALLADPKNSAAL